MLSGLASSANKLPSSSPANTTPPALETAPPTCCRSRSWDIPRPVRRFSDRARARALARPLRWRRRPRNSSSAGFCDELVYMPHCSSVITYSSPVPGLNAGTSSWWRPSRSGKPNCLPASDLCPEPGSAGPWRRCRSPKSRYRSASWRSGTRRSCGPARKKSRCGWRAAPVSAACPATPDPAARASSARPSRAYRAA